MATGENLTKTFCVKLPPGCVNVNEFVYVPVAVVEYVYPANGATVISAVVRLRPLMINVFGPAVAPTHTLPNAVIPVALIVGDVLAVVVTDISLELGDVPPALFALTT